jgi:hypothetical protein
MNKSTGNCQHETLTMPVFERTVTFTSTSMNKVRFRMKFRNILLSFSLVLLLPIQASTASNLVSPEQAIELSKKNDLIKEKVRELDDISKELIAAKAKSDAATDSVERLELESEQATARLEALQKIDRESPDTIAPEKLSAAKDKNRQSIAALSDAKAKSDEYAADVRKLNAKAIEEYAEFQILEKSFERDVDTVVNAQVDQRILSLQSAKEVEVTTRVTCGDEPVKQCKERSIKAAEVAASEQGSVVFVTSLTEVKNFKLSKDEIRSEVQATLSNKEIVKQQMFGEAEAYETTLKAKVNPVIGDTLREQMAEGIRSEIYALAGGQLDYTQVRDPSISDDADTSKKKSKKKSETDARARIEARRAARAEEERIRAEEAARAAEERRRAAAAAQAEEERRKEEERNKAARAEEERRRSGIPTINF